MAKKYIKEIADKLGKTLAATDGDHVKTIAPVYYRPADNSADSAVTTIQGALDSKQDTLTEMTETEVDNLLAVLT